MEKGHSSTLFPIRHKNDVSGQLQAPYILLLAKKQPPCQLDRMLDGPLN